MYSGSSEVISMKDIATTTNLGMAMIIYGTLPLGKYEIKAISVSASGRRDAYITPGEFEHNDPKANLNALVIQELKTLTSNFEDDYTSDNATKVRSHYEPGKYYIFLEKDGQEVAGTDFELNP